MMFEIYTRAAYCIVYGIEQRGIDCLLYGTIKGRTEREVQLRLRMADKRIASRSMRVQRDPTVR